MEDRQLAAEAAGGDQEALSALVERYRGYIYTVAHKITLHEDDALDVTQNVFVRLVEKIGSFNGRGTFRAWLATMTVHEAMSFLRRSSRREKATEPEALAEIVDARQATGACEAREALDRVQRRRLVETAMEALSPQQRAVLALRLREELGPAEIAERLGLPAQQVRTQLHRAIKAVRQMLKEGRREDEATRPA